jgi:2,5-diamino-6-(ribosylamino)-4(3H)-pyrimidinone 5'-phosphate reductase
MAISADGKISTRKRERMALGSRIDRDMMDRLRSRVDAVIIGAGTLTVDGFPLIVRNSEIRKILSKKRPLPHPVNVILSRKLDIPVRRPIFWYENIQRIIFTTRAAKKERCKRFEKYCEVVVLPTRNYLKRAMEILFERGMKKVLVEGGGELNYTFFKEKLVDELYLTVTPRIIGGSGAPTLVDGIGFLKDNHVSLELVSSRRLYQEVFLRYRVR